MPYWCCDAFENQNGEARGSRRNRKTFPNPGEAINFKKNKLVWLNDQYKSECGP
jgi:hypothetical protein